MQAFLDRVSELGLVGLVRFIMTMAFRRGVMLSRSVATTAAEHVMDALFVEHTIVSLLSAVVKNRIEEYEVDIDIIDHDGEIDKAIRLELATVSSHLLEGLSREDVDIMVKVMKTQRLVAQYQMDSQAEYFAAKVRGEWKFFLKMDQQVFEEFIACVVVMEVMGGIEATTVTAVDFNESKTPKLISEDDDSEETEDLEDQEQLALDFHGKYSELFHEKMEYFQNSKAYPLGCARVNPHFGDEASDTEGEFECLPSHLRATIEKKTKGALTTLARRVALARRGYSDPAINHLKAKNRFNGLPQLSILEYQAAYLYVVGTYGFDVQDPEMDLKSMQVMVNGGYKTSTISGDRMRSIHNQDGATISAWMAPEMRYWSSIKFKMEDFFKSVNHTDMTGPFQLSKNGNYLIGRKTEVDDLGNVWPAILLNGSLAGVMIPLGESKDEYLTRKEKFTASLKAARVFLSADEYYAKLKEAAPEKARYSWMFAEVINSKVAFIAIQGDLERQILRAAGFTIQWNKAVTDDGYWTKPNSYVVLDLNGNPRSNVIDTTGSSEIVEDHGEDLDQLDQAV